VHERRSRHASWERMAVGLVMVVMVVVVRRRRLRMLLHERYGLWDDGQRCQLPLRGAFRAARRHRDRGAGLVVQLMIVKSGCSHGRRTRRPGSEMPSMRLHCSDIR
jgi:hypothetical protein